MLCYPLFLMVGLMSKYIVTVAKLLASLPMAYFETDVGFIKLSVAAVVILIGFALILPEKPRPRITALLCIIVFLGSVLSHYILI